jgi:hypothetical protein
MLSQNTDDERLSQEFLQQDLKVFANRSESRSLIGKWSAWLNRQKLVHLKIISGGFQTLSRERKQ